MSPFKSAGASVQSTTGKRAVHISLQGLYCSCKPVFCSHVTLTGYPLHSPVSPSLLLPCVAVCHHISNAVYTLHTGRVGRSGLLGGHKNILHLLRIEPRFEIYALLDIYATKNGSYVPTFWHNLSVPSSSVKKSKKTACTLLMGPIGCAETSVTNYQYRLRNITEECRSHSHRGEA
jgi:hypothetical protein